MFYPLRPVFKCICVLALCLICATRPAQGKTEYLPRVPNSSSFSCFTCHTSSIPARNKFGADFASRGKSWSSTLARLDSDQDGKTNGQELLDPNGSWAEGQPNPGNSGDVTNPGVADAFPTATRTSSSTPTLSPIPPTFRSNRIE